MERVIIFESAFDDVLRALERKGMAVLATAQDNYPTVRMVSFVLSEGKMLFQTSTELEKYKQIMSNPHVALNMMNINIEGLAKVRDGQALDHEDFVEKFREKHENSYNAYTHMQSNRVIEIQPTKITSWIYEDGEPLRVFIDVENKEVHKEKYKHTNED